MATGGVASFEALRFAPSSVPSYSKCLPSPKRMINRCSDFIYRAPVSLIKKPCYDRIYGLSRTMRCFMIQGGFMLMIRSGLPSGPLSGHLFVPPAPAALTPRSSLRRAPFTAFSCISTLKSAHPEGCVREKTAGTGFDTYGSLWRRTDSGMEKGRGRSDGLGEGETFLENSPSPMPPDAFSAHPFCILYGDARTPFLLHGSPRIRIVRTINTNVTIRPLFRHERRLGSPLPHPETDQQGEPP